MALLLPLLLLAQFQSEPEHTGFLVACPVMLCTLGGAATGLVGFAYASANFPSGEEPAYDWIRHSATVFVIGLSSSVGSSITAHLVGKNLFEIPVRTPFSRTFLGGLAGGIFGTFLIPPSMLYKPEGKALALVSASFFSSIGAALAYEWPYLREDFQSEPAVQVAVVWPLR